MTKLIIPLLILISASFTIEAQKRTVDTDNSSVTWTGKKVTGSHTGSIDLSEGTILFENGRFSGGSFTIDMSSLSNSDLEGNMKGKLEGHLKSDDFFGVETYPAATLVITKVAPSDQGYLVTADLTIKGKTAPITFTAEVNDQGATADLNVDRTIYNVRYGSGKFFDNLGDKMIYDNFNLLVELDFAD